MQPRGNHQEVGFAPEIMQGDEALQTGSERCAPRQFARRFRNAAVLLAAVLFLLSLASARCPGFRAGGYLFGAAAYVCEIIVLTDGFKVKLPHAELFMPYCFGLLYLIMGVSQLVG